MELTRTNLGDPDVHFSILIRQERNEVTIGRQGGSLLHTTEVCESPKSSIGDWVSPEVICPLEPQNSPTTSAATAAVTENTSFHLILVTNPGRSGGAAGGLTVAAVFSFSCAV